MENLDTNRHLPVLFYCADEDHPRYSVIKTGATSESGYLHKFGGKSSYAGTTASGSDAPVQLFYVIDTSDPNCGLSIPGIRFLPLFSAIRFDSSSLIYRITSETTIEIIEQKNLTLISNWPYENYPEEFPLLPVQISEPASFNFDVKKEKFWREFVAADDQKTPTTNQIIESSAALNNCEPGTCRNPECKNSKVFHLAAFPEQWLSDQGVLVWDEYDEDVTITFHMCYSCFAIASHHIAT